MPSIAIYRLSRFTGADRWYEYVANLLNAPLYTGAKPRGYDTVIGPARMAMGVNCKTYIGCLHRDEPIGPGCSKFIYCAEWLQKKYPFAGPSMVFRPVNRFPQRNEPRKPTTGKIGMINLSTAKGGHWAKHIDRPVVAISRQRTIREVEYLPYGDPMALYNSCDIFLLPSQSEGYSTVCLEAMAQALPVIATPIPGITEVCYIHAVYAEHYNEINDAIKIVYKDYREWSQRSLDRYNKIKDLNNITELRNFVT